MIYVKADIFYRYEIGLETCIASAIKLIWIAVDHM